MHILLSLLLLLLNVRCYWFRFILPKVPDVLHPPVPDEGKITFYFISTNKNLFLAQLDANDNYLIEDQDPEVKPGLFQGDMAMDNEIYNYWRIGLRWEIFPEKLWENRTVPYVISPIYGNFLAKCLHNYKLKNYYF